MILKLSARELGPSRISKLFWNILLYIEILYDRYLNTQHHLDWSAVSESEPFSSNFELKFKFDACLIVHKYISILYTSHIIHPKHLIDPSPLEPIALYDASSRCLSRSVIFLLKCLSPSVMIYDGSYIAVFAMAFYSSVLNCVSRSMRRETGGGSRFLPLYFNTSFNSCFTRLFWIFMWKINDFLRKGGKRREKRRFAA